MTPPPKDTGPAKKRKPSEVWCVQHRSGWCATTSRGRTKPDARAMTDNTQCGMVVVLRFGSERRAPTCEECLRALRSKP